LIQRLWSFVLTTSTELQRSRLIEAVWADIGIGLVPQFTAERELRGGPLVLAHRHVDCGARGHSIFGAPQRAGDTWVELFAAWLVEVAAG
jgi:DNA-binding transcriptional LysR family regulator